jgi:hypothetical protein
VTNDNEGWRASSRCAADQPQCVEIRHQHSTIGIRDSKHPATRLTLPSSAFAGLLRHLT